MDTQRKSNVATIGKYSLVKKLGTGATSKVYLGYDSVTKNPVALKILINSDPKLVSAIKNEVALQKDLRHKNILQVQELCESVILSDANAKTQTVTTLVLEYASGGDILQLIGKLKVFPEPLARTYFQQLISALEYLHQNEIAHNDIKPENITLDGMYNIKLADFGCAVSLSRKKTFTSLVGTSKYFPPEMHQGLGYEGAAYDLFATAVTTFCMVLGHMPFAKATELDTLYSLLMKGKSRIFWRNHEALFAEKLPKMAISSDFQDLMTKMLDPNPQRRLTIEEIKSHPWYNGPTLTKSELLSAVKAAKRA